MKLLVLYKISGSDPLKETHVTLVSCSIEEMIKKIFNDIESSSCDKC